MYNSNEANVNVNASVERVSTAVFLISLRTSQIFPLTSSEHHLTVIGRVIELHSAMNDDCILFRIDANAMF